MSYFIVSEWRERERQTDSRTDKQRDRGGRERERGRIKQYLNC